MGDDFTAEDALKNDRDTKLSLVKHDKEIIREIDQFLKGEEDIDYEEPPLTTQCYEGFESFIRTCQIISGFYDVKIPKKYSREATAQIVNLFDIKKLNLVRMINLLEAGANPNALIAHRFYQSLVHAAVRKFNLRAVHYLIEFGANVNILNTRHQSPLMIACDTKVPHSINIVRYLLTIPGIDINCRDAGGNSALVNAIFKENPQIVRILIHAGVRVLDEHIGPSVTAPSGWEIAQFVFASGMYLEPKHLPPRFVNPQGLYYKYFDMKGNFDKYYHVWIQQWFKYDAYLIYRMVQRQAKKEESETAPIIIEDYIEKTKEEIKEEMEIKKKARAKRESIERKQREEEKEMERWLQLKENTTKKVDRDFSKKIHNNLTDKTYTWKRTDDGEWYKYYGKKIAIYTKAPTPNVSYMTSNKKMAGTDIDAMEAAGELTAENAQINWIKDKQGRWTMKRGGFTELGFIDPSSGWHKNLKRDEKLRKEKEEKIAAGDIDSDDEEY